VKLSRSELEALAGWPSQRVKPNFLRRKSKMAKKVSAYARFVGKQLKAGKSMKTAARMWKGKGSSKRGAKRSYKSAKKAKKSVKRNYGTHIGAVHTAKGAGTTVHRYFSRLGTKGARKHYGKRYSFLTNPGASLGRGMASFKESFKELLKVDTFIEAAEVTGGGLLSVALPNVVLNWGPVAKFTPEILKTGWGKYLVNLAAAAVASGAAGWFGKKRMAKNFLIGGVAFTVNTLVLDLLKKQATAAGAGDMTKKIAAAVGVQGLGVLPSSVESAVDKAVEAELARQGLRDMLPAGTADFMQPGVNDYLQPGMADYLQPGGVADFASSRVI
jgi:hypothetical protein